MQSSSATTFMDIIFESVDIEAGKTIEPLQLLDSLNALSLTPKDLVGVAPMSIDIDWDSIVASLEGLCLEEASEIEMELDLEDEDAYMSD